MERVDPEGEAARFGDEPLLIARAAGVPVYVGASRYEAGLLAERDANERGIHLLDDGFQHRRLARDLDIVVLHASDFEETLLPAGRLREPLASLRRASVVVLRAEDRALEAELRKRGIDRTGLDSASAARGRKCNAGGCVLRHRAAGGIFHRAAGAGRGTGSDRGAAGPPALLER